MRKGTFYCALDINTDNISGILACVDRGRVFASYQAQSPSGGLNAGRVTDLGSLCDSASLVIKKLQEASGFKIKSAYLSFSPANPILRRSSAVIPLSERANKIVTSSDIKKVNDQAYALGVNIEEEILHRIPQSYIVDGQNKVLNPEGLYGHRLEADILLLGGPCSDIESLQSAVSRLGISIDGLVFSAVALGYAFLNKNDTKAGCLLLNIGFDTAQLLFFKDGIIRGFELIKFGTDNLLQMFMRELKISRTLAVQLFSGGLCAGSQEIDPSQEVLIKKESGYMPIQKKAIYTLVENYFDDIGRAVNDKLSHYRRFCEISKGIFVFGKIASAEGFLEKLEQNLGLSAHLGKIDGDIKNYDYAVCAAIVKYAASAPASINIFDISSPANIFKKIIHRFKELYHEYF